MCFHSRGQHLCKFIGKKESVYIRKEFNSHKTGLDHKHGRCFIVLGHKYGRHDVIWTHNKMSRSVVAEMSSWLWSIYCCKYLFHAGSGPRFTIFQIIVLWRYWILNYLRAIVRLWISQACVCTIDSPPFVSAGWIQINRESERDVILIKNYLLFLSL